MNDSDYGTRFERWLWYKANAFQFIAVMLGTFTVVAVVLATVITVLYALME